MTAPAQRQSVRALRTKQAGIPLYAFFLPGDLILALASISRIEQVAGQLDGFQRPPVQRHIAAMVDYLRQGNVLFPNAILLAMSPRVPFRRSRGPSPPGLIPCGEAGLLEFPRSSGRPWAWIVDGQQRSMALAKAGALDLAVPVIAFATDDLKIHREQFVLVNRARPLPRRLIDELLPQIDAGRLPQDMAVRQIPSALVNQLDADPSSPFHQLIRRTTSPKDPSRVVLDAALVKCLARQIKQPLGALAPFRSVDGDSTDPDAMYGTIVSFWSTVRDVFPEAWGRPPEQSRLMHSAGIDAMASLMDFLATRVSHHPNAVARIRAVLDAIKPDCAWTEGHWPDIGAAWNDIEATPRSANRLTDQLVRLAQSALTRAIE